MHPAPQTRQAEDSEQSLSRCDTLALSPTIALFKDGSQPLYSLGYPADPLGRAVIRARSRNDEYLVT